MGERTKRSVNSFLVPAGARLMTVLYLGQSNPLLRRAGRTHSRLSFTAVSGRPTMAALVFDPEAQTRRANPREATLFPLFFFLFRQSGIFAQSGFTGPSSPLRHR